MENFIISFDVFGQEFTPEFEDSKSFKTKTGLCFTIILLTACIVLSILFGQEIYQRENPNVTYSDTVQNYFQIPLSDVPFLFQLRNTATSKSVKLLNYLIPDSNIYDVYNGNITLKKTSPLEPCSIDFYPSFKNSNVSNDFDFADYYCLNPKNFIIQNLAYSNNSMTLRIDFYKCNKLKFKCADDLDLIFNALNLAIVYPDSLVDPKDYEKPINIEYVSTHNIISNVLVKIRMFSYSLNTLVSDYGWLLENIDKVSYIQLASSEVQYNILDIKDSFPKFVFMIGGSPVGKKITRSYMKIQDLFAKIGGIANVAYIICYVISYDFLRFKFLFNVKNLLLKQLESNSSCLPIDINNNASQDKLKEENPVNLSDSKFIYNNIKDNKEKENKFENQLPEELHNNQNSNSNNKFPLSTINNLNKSYLNKTMLGKINTNNPFAEDKNSNDDKKAKIGEIIKNNYAINPNEEVGKSCLLRNKDQRIVGRSSNVIESNKEDPQDNSKLVLNENNYQNDSNENIEKNELNQIIGELGKLKIEVSELVKNNLNINNQVSSGANKLIKAPSLIKIRQFDLNEYTTALEEIPNGKENYLNYLAAYCFCDIPQKEKYEKILKMIKKAIKIDMIWRLIAENYNLKD